MFKPSCETTGMFKVSIHICCRTIVTSNWEIKVG